MNLVEICNASNDCELWLDRDTGNLVLRNGDHTASIVVETRQFPSFLENIEGFIADEQRKQRKADK